jgi:hypothetical protein
VSIIDSTRRVNPTRYDPKINESGMNLIFFDTNRVGSGSGQSDPINYVFEVIL